VRYPFKLGGRVAKNEPAPTTKPSGRLTQKDLDGLLSDRDSKRYALGRVLGSRHNNYGITIPFLLQGRSLIVSAQNLQISVFRRAVDGGG